MVLGALCSAGILSATLANVKRQFPVIQAVRWWRERPVYTRRYGYNIDWHVSGPLPRIKASPDVKPLRMPAYQPQNSWSQKKAVFGQNDYIDILGDGTIHPRDLLTGPHWLKGFRGNEFQRLIRQRGYVYHYMPTWSPTSWNNLEKRIKYLYKYYNNKQNHKDWIRNYD